MAKETEKKEVTAKSITEQLAEAKAKEEKKDTAEEKRLYKCFRNQIDKAFEKAENSYLEIAFSLHSIYDRKLYRLDDYQNIYEFAKDNYAIKKTSCNNFINIAEVFGLPNENGTITALKEEYKDFTSSKLIVMLNFKDNPAYLAKCTPDMSVRQLKELVKGYKNALEDKESDDTEEEEDVIDTDAKEVSSEPMNEPEPVDVDKDAASVLVAQARSLEELLTMQEVIEETLEDIKIGNHKKDAKIEIRIVF